MSKKLVIKKFGGSSLSSVEKISKIALRLSKKKDKNCDIVVVVSAMGNATDELFNLAYQISKNPSQRELDMLLTAGERISMSLLSLALQKYGLQSISFTGSQSGVITDTSHGNARIIDVKAFRIRKELEKNKIVIVAGFQGVSIKKEVTTLGRGGSDTSAVALAAYLNADNCQIYTDVDSIYSADPRIIKDAAKLTRISYENMLEMALSGARVIHPRAVDFAKKYGIKLEIKSSFKDYEGTIVENRKYKENNIIAVTGEEFLILLRIKGLTQINEFYNWLTNDNIDFYDYFHIDDMLYIVLKESELKKIKMMKTFNDEIKKERVSSVVPVGDRLADNTKMIKKIFKTLNSEKIIPKMSSYFPNSIKIYIEREDFENALNLIHDEFIIKKEV